MNRFETIEAFGNCTAVYAEREYSYTEMAEIADAICGAAGERTLVFCLCSNNKESQAGLPDVDYVFYGPRERKLGKMLIGPELNEVYSVQDLQIFETGSPPAISTEKGMVENSIGKPIK